MLHEKSLMKRIERMGREFKAQRYLKRFADKETFYVDGVYVTAWTPKGEEFSQFDYRSAYENAIKRNNTIFGHEVSRIEFVRVRTTDEYNQYRSMIESDVRIKQKGDGAQGSSIEDKIVLIDYSTLGVESSLFKDHGGDEESIKKNYQAIINHELAHTYTRKLWGERYNPKWFYEALGILVGPQRSRDLMAEKLRLKEGLSKIKGLVPDTEELCTPDANGKIILYSYATSFTQWLFQQHTTDRIPFTEEDQPAENIYKIERIKLFADIARQVGKGKSFDNGFMETFGISYQEAHTQFVDTLQ
ncbi:MAG: hypothetical protein V1922_00635 [bacterium]